MAVSHSLTHERSTLSTTDLTLLGRSQPCSHLVPSSPEHRTVLPPCIVLLLFVGPLSCPCFTPGQVLPRTVTSSWGFWLACEQSVCLSAHKCFSSPTQCHRHTSSLCVISTVWEKSRKDKADSSTTQLLLPGMVTCKGLVTECSGTHQECGDVCLSSLLCKSVNSHSGAM